MKRRSVITALSGTIATLTGCSSSLPSVEQNTPAATPTPTATETPTPTAPPTSTYRRYGTEDPSVVDVAARYWTASEITAAKGRAGTFDYRDVLRNAESRAADNDIVKSTGTIGQAIEDPAGQTVLVFVGDSLQQPA
jgi:hypothetical protein